MLVSIVLFSFTMLAVTEMTLLVTKGSVKVSNTAEGLNAARVAINRINHDVRLAKMVGVASQQVLPTPAAGFPGPPWNQNLNLSDSVLLLQIPVFYDDLQDSTNPFNGMPIMVQQKLGSADTPSNMENFDVVVYQVVPDPDRQSEFLLQVARFPGKLPPALKSNQYEAINPPRTILRGLIGPFSKTSTSLPSIFSYMGKLTATAPYAKCDPSKVIVSGVAVDLEIKNTGTQTGDGPYTRQLGLHSQTYLRANKNMTLNNTSSAIP